MEENKQHFWHITLYYFKKSKNKTETHTKNFSAVCGEGAGTDRTYQKWFAKFPAGGFSLDDAPQSSRPVEADSDQMETLTENSQCYTTRGIADILRISKSTKVLVKMKNICFILWKKLDFLANPIFNKTG